MTRKKHRSNGSLKQADDDLFTAPEVARFCKVDLKTIHNWVDRAQIKHFRTPGRHLRFRRADVLEFLRRFDYPIPADLQPRRPRILLLGADAALVGNVRRSMGGEVDLEVFDDAFVMMLHVGAEVPEVIVVDAETIGPQLEGLVGALRRFEQTRTTRIVVFGRERMSPVDSSVDVWLSRAEDRDIRSVIDSLIS